MNSAIHDGLNALPTEHFAARHDVIRFTMAIGHGQIRLLDRDHGDTDDSMTARESSGACVVVAED